MLVTKKHASVFMLLHTNEHKEALVEAEYFAFATHCLNERLRELNEKEPNRFDRKWFNVKDAYALKQVGVIVLSANYEKLKGIQFYKNKDDATVKLNKIISKKPHAQIIEVDVLTNVPKSEQKTKK